MIRISAILLGAGESKRMGMNKLLLPWKKKTIFSHCIDTLLRSEVEEVIVVLSDRTKELKSQFRNRRVKMIMNPHSQKGISTSIRRGIRAIDQKSHGILIAFGDMPFLGTRTVNKLIHVFGQGMAGVIVPYFQRRQGHPVIFHKRYQKELLELKGDVGARSIIERHPGDVRLVRTKSEGVVKDIDTWNDYRKRVKNPYQRVPGLNP